MLKSLILACACSYFLISSCIAQRPESRQHFQDFGEKIVGGTWHQQLPQDLTSRHTYKWALGHEYLISYRWHKRGPNSLTILGVDPESGIQTAWDFDDEGNVHVTVMKTDSLTPTTQEIELSGKAAAWEFTSRGATSKMTFNENGKTIFGDNTQSNGEKRSFNGSFTLDGDTLRYKSKIGRKGEEPKPYGWNYRDAN